MSKIITDSSLCALLQAAKKGNGAGRDWYKSILSITVSTPLTAYEQKGRRYINLSINENAHEAAPAHFVSLRGILCQRVIVSIPPKPLDSSNADFKAKHYSIGVKATAADTPPCVEAIELLKEAMESWIEHTKEIMANLESIIDSKAFEIATKALSPTTLFTLRKPIHNKMLSAYIKQHRIAVIDPTNVTCRLWEPAPTDDLNDSKDERRRFWFLRLNHTCFDKAMGVSVADFKNLSVKDATSPPKKTEIDSNTGEAKVVFRELDIHTEQDLLSALPSGTVVSCFATIVISAGTNGVNIVPRTNGVTVWSRPEVMGDIENLDYMKVMPSPDIGD